LETWDTENREFLKMEPNKTGLIIIFHRAKSRIFAVYIRSRRSKADKQRTQLRNEFWPNEDAWIADEEVGYFRAPRTLPLILHLLSLEGIRGKHDPTSVYIELWSRDFGQGVIMMTNEQDHAYAAGYKGPRGLRSWQERMNLLEELGFIKTKEVGNQRYKYVMLVHPSVVIENLRQKNKIDQRWYDTYRTRQIEIKEPSYAEREEAKRAKEAEAAARVAEEAAAASSSKMVNIKTRKPKAGNSAKPAAKKSTKAVRGG
jgi:hypothetical protein